MLRETWLPSEWQKDAPFPARMRLAEEFEEAVLTVGLVILFLEGSFVELLEAEGTDKVFWVKFLGHGSDAASRDGLLAAGTQRAAAFVIMHLTVGLPIMLKEAAVDERRETFLQEEEAKGNRLIWQAGDTGNSTIHAFACHA